MKTTFKLKWGETSQTLGTITFNGKFIFKLDNNVDLNLWNKIGFIHVDDSRSVESKDLFKHLNARLPIMMRQRSNEEKIEYIKNSKLKVASDSFYLEYEK